MAKINSSKKLREFGYTAGIGFPLIIGWILPSITGHPFRIWTFWISIPLILLGIFAPSKLNSIYKGWMLIGHTLGWLNSKILLGLVFIIVLQPIAFFMKLFGYDPLGKNKANVSSYKDKKKDVKIDLTRIF